MSKDSSTSFIGGANHKFITLIFLLTLLFLHQHLVAIDLNHKYTMLYDTHTSSNPSLCFLRRSNYGLAHPLENCEILRVVVREDFSEDMADQLIHDILSITEDLSKDSTSAHLAHIGSKSQNSSSGGAAGASSSSSKHPSHSKLSKNISKPDAGRGHKHGGYAKQC